MVFALRTAEKAGLERLHTLIRARMLEGAGDDPYARWQLEQGEEARKMHQKLLEYPLVAHLLRPDSPIVPEELVPSLLSEEEDAIQATMAMLDPDQREQLIADAEALLNRLAGEYLDLPSLRIRLEAMRKPMEF
jgi:hypothetical protein